MALPDPRNYNELRHPAVDSGAKLTFQFPAAGVQGSVLVYSFPG